MSVVNADSRYEQLVRQGCFSDSQQLLQHLLQRAEIREIDYHFAWFVTSLCQWPDTVEEAHRIDHRLLQLVAAKLSLELEAGHVCVPLSAFSSWFEQLGLETVPDDWYERLLGYPVVSRGLGDAPIVFDFDCFYLERYWRYEKQIADFTQYSTQYSTPHSMQYAIQLTAEVAIPLAEKAVAENLQRLFGPLSEHVIDWQRVAACAALNQPFLMISGGPGTGKTTTVIKLLALILEQLYGDDDSLPVIRMAAPTGKAAARLSESIRAAKEQLDAPERVKHFIPESAQTLHRLLGYVPHSTRYRHNRDNPLLVDVLVVDEASMIDVAMMAKLLESLPGFTRLILLGDKDQLSSVEAGSVFADLHSVDRSNKPITQQIDLHFNASDAVPGQSVPGQSTTGHSTTGQWDYSAAQTRWLLSHGGVHPQCLPQNFPVTGVNDDLTADYRASLYKSFRFRDDSGIKQLADASNRGDAVAFLQILQRGAEDVIWYNLEKDLVANEESLKPLIDAAVTAYSGYLDLLKQQAQPEQVLRAFERYRILCAANHGETGVQGINRWVENALLAAGRIEVDSQFYIGRPIIIETNNYDLKLFNGDIGVCMADAQGARFVAFLGADGGVRRFVPGRIPQHRTVYAMTVHKSQGSEFDHTALVLPQVFTPLLSRELLYTAVTRAKAVFSLYGNEALIQRMVATRTHRWSGLGQRLGTM